MRKKTNLFVGFSYVAPELLNRHSKSLNQRPTVEEVTAYNLTVISICPMMNDRMELINLFSLPLTMFGPPQDGGFFDAYKFTSKEPIGHGTYSICMKCMDLSTHKTYAVKILKSSINAKTEIETLRTCSGHTNIIEFVEVIKDDKYTYIVTELLEGPELFAYVQKNPLSEIEARNLFKEILAAVQFMHSKRIVHRDLKLENIMFTHENSATLKLIDFGFAACIGNRLMDTPCYTLEYAAPEILSNKKYSEACDLWSLGVILYTLLCGHMPFQRRNESQDDHEIRERIKRGAIDTDSSAWQSLNKSAKDLVRKLLTVCPNKRMKLKDINDSNWFDAPVNSHSSATEIIESAIEQVCIEVHTPKTLITVPVVATTLEKSHSTSSTSINSLSESGATSELGLSKSSSGIGIASDQFNRSISIDSTASTIRNELIPDQDHFDDTKEILVTTISSVDSDLNGMRFEAIEAAEMERLMDTHNISDSESEMCVNTDGEYNDLCGYERHAASVLRHVQHAMDLEKVLLYPDEDMLLPCPGRTIELEAEHENVTSPSKSKRNRRDAIARKRNYSNSSDEKWFDEPINKLTKVVQIDDNDCTVYTPKRFTRSSMRRQMIH